MAQQGVAERWPGREAEAAKLFALAGPGAHHVPNFFVFGVPSTGKTSVVRDCLPALGRKHAYVQCTETVKPKQLLGSIYTQLHGYKRKPDEGYAGVPSDSAVDFIKELPGICKPMDRTSLVVLDDAHWLARTPLLRALLQAREQSGGASVAFVLVSQQAWGCGEFEDLACMPIIHFPVYSPEQMVTALVKMRWCSVADQQQSPAQLRTAFCELIVGTFRDTTLDVVDLATLAGHLWPCYIEPVKAGKVSMSDSSIEQVVRKLYSKDFKLQLQAARRVYEPGMRVLPRSASAAYASTSGAAAPQQRHHQALELPEMTKLLAIAAYIASYNKPTLDKQVFDVKTRTGRVRGRAANMSSDRQVEAAKEARLKGPHSFPLQRVLTLLSYLQSGREVAELEAHHLGTSNAHVQAGLDAAGCSGGLQGDLDLDLDVAQCSSGGSDGDDEPAGGSGRAQALGRVAPWWRRQQDQEQQRRQLQQLQRRGHLGGSTVECADVLVHLNTLASMQLLSKAESELADPLDGAKYTCHISEDYATSMAESLNLRLVEYIRYA